MSSNQKPSGRKKKPTGSRPVSEPVKSVKKDPGIGSERRRRKDGRRRSGSSDEDHSDHFQIVNERAVEDIKLDFFYKPHTLTLLLLVIAFMFYTAFTM